MEWQGEKIRTLAKEKNISLAKLAALTGVSRQTVNSWIKGQTPKGLHLISICRNFEIAPDYLFSDTDYSIAIPLHRTRQTAKVTPALQADALKLAKEYALLFRNDPESAILPVARVRTKNSADAKAIAENLRRISGVKQDEPIGYKDTFRLLEKLGIKVIFRYFPEKIKAYAFFTKIYSHRVIFVNNTTNVLDLIFPLIHEAVHAIRDERLIDDIYDTDEEGFCDEVANHTQFPDEYVHWVWEHLKSREPAIQINTLKTFSEKHGHALFGLAKRINSIYPEFNPKLGGANTNLKKRFPAIGDIIFQEKDPREFVNRLKNLSPLFVATLMRQIDSMTNRKVAEILAIDNIIDGDAIKRELQKLTEISSSPNLLRLHEYLM
jgi:transcriptional regulator with XRE-family HTH domain